MVRFVSAVMALALASPILAMPGGTPTNGNGTTVTVVTTATSTAYVCECALQCSNEKKACLSVPDCDKKDCWAKYHECVGHKPAGGDATECTKEAAKKKFSITQEECPEAVQCRQQCDNEKDKCMTTPDCDESSCTATHYVCHTVCTGINNKNKNNNNNNNKNKNKNNHHQCIEVCENTKSSCLAVPGCDQDKCHSDCESCKVVCKGKPINKGKPIDTNNKNNDQCIQVCETTKSSCLAVPGCDQNKCNSDCDSCKVVCKGKPIDQGKPINKGKPVDTNNKNNDQCIQVCETTKTSCLAVPGCDQNKCNTDCDSCKVVCKGKPIDHGKPIDTNNKNTDTSNKKGSNECETKCYTIKDNCMSGHGGNSTGHGGNSCDSECTICLAKCPSEHKVPVTAGVDRAQPMLAAALVAIGFAALI